MATLPKITEKISEIILASNLTDKTSYTLNKVEFANGPEAKSFIKLKGVTFKKCLFSHQHITDFSFQNCIFEDCQFNGTVFDKGEFHRCSFDNCTFYKTQISNTYLDPSTFTFNYKWYTMWANVNAGWFQAVFRNSKIMHQEDFAMVADVKFQFYKRYEYLFGKNKKPIKFTIGLLYDICLGYGYGIWSALITTCFFILLFAMLMLNDVSTIHDHGFLESIYFSVVSFTTVGYGEITPTRSVFALSVTTLFLFFSVVWGAIVTAVIVKRLVR